MDNIPNSNGSLNKPVTPDRDLLGMNRHSVTDNMTGTNINTDAMMGINGNVDVMTGTNSNAPDLDSVNDIEQSVLGTNTKPLESIGAISCNSETADTSKTYLHKLI